MNVRSLHELYQEHQEKYPDYKQNGKLSSQLFDEHLESKQGYIFSVSYLLMSFSENAAAFIGIMPLDLENLDSIENSIIKMTKEIDLGNYDAFDESSANKAFEQLRRIKSDIEDFSNNIALMQLFIDAKTNHPLLYEKIAQYFFAQHLENPILSWSSEQSKHTIQNQNQNPVELIEAKVTKFEEQKLLYERKVEQLRVQCQKLGECLLMRTVKRDTTEQFRQAVYQRQTGEEKLQLSVAPTATHFASNAKREESPFISSASSSPSPSPNQ